MILAASNAASQKMNQTDLNIEKEKYKEKYLFTPHRTSLYPFLTESTRRDLREKLYKSYILRGDTVSYTHLTLPTKA